MQINIESLKSKKNDFSFSFYLKVNHPEHVGRPNKPLFTVNRVYFLPYVHSPLYALKMAKYKYGKKWTYVQVFERRTRNYLGHLMISSDQI